MLNSIEQLAKEFLSLEKPIRIITHFDTDGVTSGAIISKTIQRLDKKFSIKIVKGLDEQTLKKEL